MRAAAVVVASVYFALLTLGYLGCLDVLSVRGLRGWWNDRLTVWRLRAEWKRRKRAQRAAQRALDPDDLFEPRPKSRRSDVVVAIGLVLAIVALAMLGAGCGGRYPIDGAPDAGLADAGAPSEMTGPAPDGAPADAHEPECAPLSPGEEFYAADTGAELATLILNDQGCMKFCRNTAGGATCVSAQNALVRCAACQGVSP